MTGGQLAAHPFSNKWLNLAIVWEFLLLGLILYLPFLRNAFRTAPCRRRTG